MENMIDLVMSPIGVMAFIIGVTFVAGLLWVHTSYLASRQLNSKHYLSSKMEKKFREEYFTKLGIVDPQKKVK